MAIPVSIPTDRGNRELIDLGSSVVNFQRLENPQTSIHQCGTVYGTQVVRSLFEKLEERDLKPAFTELNLSDNRIGDEGAIYLSQGLAGTKSCKQLLVPRCEIKIEGFKAMGQILAECDSIEEIVASGNYPTAEGVKGPFAAGLAKNKTLKSLYLSANRLGDEGVAALCPALKIHPMLEHCSLLYNRLEAPVIGPINDMLAGNQALRYLDISGNTIGINGAIELVKGLQANKGRLMKLGMAQNEIRLEGCRALSMFFLDKAGQHMEFMDLRHNLVTYMGMVDLRKEVGYPLDENSEEGWLLLYPDAKKEMSRQLYLNAH